MGSPTMRRSTEMPRPLNPAQEISLLVVASLGLAALIWGVVCLANFAL